MFWDGIPSIRRGTLWLKTMCYGWCFWCEPTFVSVILFLLFCVFGDANGHKVLIWCSGCVGTPLDLVLSAICESPLCVCFKCWRGWPFVGVWALSEWFLIPGCAEPVRGSPSACSSILETTMRVYSISASAYAVVFPHHSVRTGVEIRSACQLKARRPDCYDVFKASGALSLGLSRSAGSILGLFTGASLLHPCLWQCRFLFVCLPASPSNPCLSDCDCHGLLIYCPASWMAFRVCLELTL